MSTGATKACGWGAESAEAPLKYMTFERRALHPDDVSIKIAFCGVCQSDIHTATNGWGGTMYPVVPGHEIVGHVEAVGDKVKKYKVGDAVAVGCMVDSCLQCDECKHHLEQFCVEGSTLTYDSKSRDGTEVTRGGYSDHVVVREHFVLRVPDNLDLAKTAPLLCAGITTFSPLHHWGVKKGTKVGVVGLGGLGHMAVKLAHAMGAEVSVFTTSQSKVEDAKRLGAHKVIISKDESQMKAAERSLDLIVDTVGVPHDLAPYIATLCVDGTDVLVGAPDGPSPPLNAFTLIMGRRSLAGSCIGGIKETQEMLDFCGKHNIAADVEVINIDYINEAYKRMLKNDVKYRFVIDMKSLKMQ